MTILKTLQQNEKPYWIIVSDEGPASFPYQHETYQSAYEESIRLAQIKPGLKFNVFKYVGHGVAEKPKVRFNSYSEPVAAGFWFGPRFNNQRDDEVPF